MAASRTGSDLLALKPISFRVPAWLASDTFGANTLVGVRDADGYAEQYVAGNTYQRLLVATREFDTTDDADGDVRAKKGLRSHIAIKLDTDVAPDQSWLGETAYAADHGTASLDSDSVGDGTGTSFSEIGEVVQVESDAVYVRVTA